MLLLLYTTIAYLFGFLIAFLMIGVFAMAVARMIQKLNKVEEASYYRTGNAAGNPLYAYYTCKRLKYGVRLRFAACCRVAEIDPSAPGAMSEQAWNRMKAKVVTALGATFESFNVEDYSIGLSNERVFRVSGYVMYSGHARELAKAKP